jgi:Family of unknown function (DUF6263)
MRHQLIPFWCALSILALLDACKKSEQPAATNPKPEGPSSAQPAASAATIQPPAGAEKGVLLKIKWPVGNRYVYRMDLDQHVTNRFPQMPKPMQQDVTMAMTYALSVTKELPQDGREIEMEFLANEMEVKMADQVIISFDSKETGKNDAQNPFSAPFRKMIGSKLAIQLEAQGKVDKIPGLEEWQKTLSGDQPGPAGGMLAQQFGEGFFRQILDAGRAFPDKPVQVGETWPYDMEVPAGPIGKITINGKLTFKGWEDRQEHKCVALLMTGTFKGSSPIETGQMGKMNLENGKAAGTSWFDPELGALIDSTSDQIMRLKGEVPGGPTGGNRAPTAFTIEIGQKVTLTLAELGKVKQ